MRHKLIKWGQYTAQGGDSRTHLQENRHIEAVWVRQLQLQQLHEEALFQPPARVGQPTASEVSQQWAAQERARACAR